MALIDYYMLGDLPLQRTSVNEELEHSRGSGSTSPPSPGPPMCSEASLASMSTQSSSSQVRQNVVKPRLSKKVTKSPSIIVPKDTSAARGPLQYFYRLLQWGTGICSLAQPAPPKAVRKASSNGSTASSTGASPLPSPTRPLTAAEPLDDLRKRPYANRFIQFSLEMDSEVSPASRAWLAPSQRRVQRLKDSKAEVRKA
ncbi:unnamed protein product [Durusdinium trenchii]|uniref:Uncharacterized protein n=1 Tax=Durusdinium trenchii TaxID=1381693 RepID=A0ABP0M313_9DINO